MKKIPRRRSAAVGALHHPLTRRTPPRSEKNGFEPEFEPPFWDILADMGGRPAIKSSLLAVIIPPFKKKLMLFKERLHAFLVLRQQ